MDTAYWNQIAANYEDEIFNVYANDQGNVLAGVVGKYAKKQGLAADFGCGIGNGISLLAKHFAALEAFDYSYANIRRCHERFAGLSGCRFQQHNLVRSSPARKRFDFALCTSVLIMPSLTERKKILANVVSSIKPGARLAIVVPSLESACLVNARTIEKNLRKKLSPAAAVRSGFDREPDIPATDFRQGILPIQGVRTKHYLREELFSLPANGVNVESVSKVEYGWHCVFERVPKLLNSPLPWDWCAVLRRKT